MSPVRHPCNNYIRPAERGLFKSWKDNATPPAATFNHETLQAVRMSRAPSPSTRVRLAIEATTPRRVGLYPLSDFTVGKGESAGDTLTPSARHFFAQEYVAVPRPNLTPASFAHGVTAPADVANWVAAGAPREGERPPLIWIATPDPPLTGQLAPDAQHFVAEGVIHSFALVPKLELNRSWFDASSAAYFSARTARVRGEMQGDALVGRVLWPTDFRVNVAGPLDPLPEAANARLAIRAAMRAEASGGAQSAFHSQIFWERRPGRREWSGKPVLVAQVNGAQGDDDEAWGGHFAIGTGILPEDGAISDVLINNFYSLDIVSEKGTLAAPVPFDGYLADLNSGQAWYRPTYVVVAVLSDARAATLTQAAFDRVFQQFWRHQLVYRHTTMNCSSISVDTLRATGWKVAARRSASKFVAWLGVPYALVKYRSLAQARNAYEYLDTDATRLYPAAAFEEVGADLMRFATRGAVESDGPLPRMLAEDLEALVFLRVPQLPSSRKFGTFPIVSPEEFLGAVPRDPSQAQVVPVPPRPFPPELRDPDLLPEPIRSSTIPIIVWAVVLFAMIATLVLVPARTLL